MGASIWSAGGVNPGPANVIEIREEIVATAGQTVFNLTFGTQYVPGTNNLDVFRNGQLLYSGDYTETDYDTITMTSFAASVGDKMLFVIRDNIGITAVVDQQLRTDLANASDPVKGAAMVGNIPAGSISSTTVQAAINELDTFLQIGTGAVARTTLAKLQESVSVKDFGAVGDGVTDDRAAIQLAITEASASGKYVFIPAGTYRVTKGAAQTSEEGTTYPVFTMASNMHIWAEPGATIKLADNQSTDGAPTRVDMFFSNSVLSNISIRGLTMDMNGANNAISPSRPVTYNTYNMAQFSFSGTPGGLAARANDVLIENCTFKNNPGVCCIVAGQSNTTSVLLGKRWTIRNNLFLNNCTDSSDFSAIFGWTDYMLIDGNVFWNDTQPNTVGLTGASTAHEIHGSNHRFVNNQIINYRNGLYVASNFSTAVTASVVANNNFYCTNSGILLFRQQSPASAAVDGVLIEGNTFYFDNYTYSGQPTTRSAISFQGQISTQQLAVNNVKICNNYAIAVGTNLFSHFVRWDTVVNVTSLCSNLSITDNQVIGFTHGVYLLCNAANGQGYTEISRNQFINLTPDSLANEAIGVRVNATGTVKTLVMDNNQFIDERGAAQFARGIYLDSGTITSFSFGPQIYRSITTNYAEVNGIAITAFLSTSHSGTYSPTFTNVANVGAYTGYNAQFMRQGSVVTVSGKVNIDPTAAGATALGISLPVASNFATEEQCSGVAASEFFAGESAAIFADTANNRATLQFVAVDISNKSYRYTFTYSII